MKQKVNTRLDNSSVEADGDSNNSHLPMEYTLSMEKKLMTKCVGATDRCYLGGPCDACEAVWPLRYEDGRFAPYLTEEEENAEG